MKKKFIRDQKAKLANGHIDRRQFITAAIAAGVALPSAMSMATDVLAATPKSGGHLRQGFGHGSTTDSLDPGTHENGFMQNFVYSYTNNLTEVDNHGKLVPELAEEIGASDDAKTWTFKLRKGVEFHNGKSLTAEDVINSFNFHRGEDSKSAGKGLLGAVENIRADGDSTVVFELNSGNADFPFIASDYHLVIMPTKDGKMDYQSGVGTGAYKLEKFEPGVRAVFAKNPNYFKEGRGHFDSVETLSLLDTTARQNAVMNGDVEVIDKVDPKTVHLLSRVPTIDILETTGTQHYTFPMRVDASPFDNYDLRMAIKYGIKRQELVDKILLGHGSIGNDHPISVANQYHASDLPQREYDADKARAHLKKAGLEGATVQLSTSDAAFPGAVDAALLVKAAVETIGLNVEIVREPKDGYWSNVWNKKPWCACYWGGRPTEDWMFSSAYTNDTEWNDTAWKDTDGAKKFNEIVVQARSELDPAKRRELYAECQRLINDDGGAIVPMWANHIHGVSKKIAHDEAVAGNWQNDGNKNTERWWFA